MCTRGSLDTARFYELYHLHPGETYGRRIHGIRREQAYRFVQHAVSGDQQPTLQSLQRQRNWRATL